jgi:uncharacterized protein (DUF3084 family)
MNTLQELEQRIAALENKKPEVGPRGPAGNVESAVAAANRTVADAENRLQKGLEDNLARFRAELERLHKEYNNNAEVRFAKMQLDIVDLRAEFVVHLTDTIKNQVENSIVNVLREYGVLD